MNASVTMLKEMEEGLRSTIKHTNEMVAQIRTDLAAAEQVARGHLHRLEEQLNRKIHLERELRRVVQRIQMVEAMVMEPGHGAGQGQMMQPMFQAQGPLPPFQHVFHGHGNGHGLGASRGDEDGEDGEEPHVGPSI